MLQQQPKVISLESVDDATELLEHINSLTPADLERIARHRGRQLAPDGNWEKFRQSLKVDQFLPVNERVYEMITEATGPAGNEVSRLPVIQQQQGGSLDFYDRIADPLAAADQLGTWFHKSGMVGCSLDAGRVLALACMSMKKSPFEIMQKYHIIDGKLSMRADAMLAEFNRLGGDHEILQRDEDRVAVRLTWNGKKSEFAFTWTEAEKEPFTKAKGGKVKDNYATPRARMQMLWARLVSDAVRAVCPQVNSGIYTPEENGDSTVIDAEYQVVESKQAEAAPVENGNGTARPSGKPLARENGGVTAVVNEMNAQQAAKETAKEETKEAVAEVTLAPDTGDLPISNEQKQLIKDFVKKLNIKPASPEWKGIVSQYKVETINSLSIGGADLLLSHLSHLCKINDLIALLQLTPEALKPVLEKLEAPSVLALKWEGVDRLFAFLQKRRDKLPPSKEKEDSKRRDEMDAWAEGATVRKS